jgi:hypothetical protein
MNRNHPVKIRMAASEIAEKSKAIMALQDEMDAAQELLKESLRANNPDNEFEDDLCWLANYYLPRPERVLTRCADLIADIDTALGSAK